MIDETDYKTFIYISKNRYQIFVYDKDSSKSLYNEEIKIIEDINLNNFSKFLDENIYKIEKKVNYFIRNIILIIDDDEVLNVGISIKKKYYEKQTDQKYLENSLIEVKDIFRENYQDQILMHMVIVNNETNEKLLSKNEDIKVDYLYLEVNLICISNSFTHIFDKLLENHQIKVARYMSGNYIKNYFGEAVTELSIMANKLNNGLNKNEVQLVSKNIENKGFFEKFFQLFS